MKRRRVLACVQVFAGLIVALFACPRVALASNLVVGDGTPASCTDVALANAIIAASRNGPDVIRFDCGSDPVTIPLSGPEGSSGDATRRLMLPDRTTIDGGGLIALDNWNGVHIELGIDRDATVTLKNLTFEGHLVRGIINLGNLTVHNVTFHARAGAIISSGTLSVKNSSFSRSFYLPTIENLGDAAIDQSVFFENGWNASTIVNGDGTLDIRNTVFTDNSVDSGGTVQGGGTITINNSRFTGSLSLDGAAIIGWGSLTVMNSTFSHNGAAGPGTGAIRSSGIAIIKHCEFFNNFSEGLGGAIANSGVMTVEHSVISGNQAWKGGGIFNHGTLLIRSSLITSNNASQGGGGSEGGIGGGIYLTETASLTLVNTDVFGNTPDDIWPD
jgi:hypothetical protein